MIYFFLRPLIYIYFQVFFKKIYFTGAEHIPKDKSIVFAVNHPTAFLDPILVASQQMEVVHFMLRGDIFKSPLIRWLLAQIKTIPIFRFRDGFSALKNNKETFDLVYQKLHEGHNILILAEGLTKHEKKMRPIQKGAARMVFGAFEVYNDLNVVVIPVGVNYTDSDAFRSMITVDFGPSIPLSQYFEIHAENPRKAIKQLTDEISRQMYSRIVHIDKDEDAVFVEGLLEINRHNMHHPVIPTVDRKNKAFLEKEKWITETINTMEEGKKAKLKERVLSYLDQLKNAGIKEIGLAHRQRYSLLNTLILVIGFIPFLLGIIGNFLPLAIAKFIANRKVEKIEFHSSIRFAVGMLLHFVQFTAVLITCSLIWGWYGFGLALLVPVFGFFSLFYLDFFKSWNEARLVAKLDNKLVKTLLQERLALFSSL